MSQKDESLVAYVVQNTRNGSIRWEEAAGDAFMASLRGDHTVTVESRPHEPDTLILRNREGQVILQLDESDYPGMQGLFSLARRNAFNIDKVIDEIIAGPPPSPSPRKAPATSSSISDEDIPF